MPATCTLSTEGITLSEVEFRSGDFVRVKESLVVHPDTPFRGCKKVRQMRDYEVHGADIPQGTGGIILGSALDNTHELSMVLINNGRYIIWNSMMDLITSIEVAE